MNEPVSVVRSDLVSGSLPTKITGIVFWGTLLVGLLIALIMLYGRESELVSLQATNTILLEHEVADALRNVPAPFLTNKHDSLVRTLQTLQAQLHFEAIEISSPGDIRILIGKKSPEQNAVTRSLLIPSQGITEPTPVNMTVYFLDISDTISNYRRHVLMAIGLMVVIYALILQNIFRVLLSIPFARMVSTAKNFAEGNAESRFDETYRNEFGFLSQFINKALDSIAAQQKELSEALARATQSEAALFREKELAEVTLQSINEAVITTNATGEVQYLNPVAERITGWGNAEAHNLPLSTVITIVQENSGKQVPNPVYECLKNNRVVNLDTHGSLLRRDGESVAIEASAAPMRSGLGAVIGAVMVCQDVSQARKFAYQLSYQAGHDSLTGLYNRREFDIKLCDLLESSKLSGSMNILLYLDLDQFKVVNDTCGHTAGDKLLLQLSVLLGHKVRKNDILARLGGDEFGVLLMGCDIEFGKKVANGFLELISDFRFIWEDKIFQVGVSIGLVPITASTESSAEVMSAADAACYAAKDRGRNRIHVFHGDEGQGKKYGEMQWVPRIHKAMAENRLHLYRQNIVSLESGDTAEHAEILLRMESEEDGSIIIPMAFIPAAERYNLMPLLDRWVISKALEWLEAYPLCKNGLPQHLAINISGQSLGDEQFLNYIVSQLEQTKISPKLICLEITETSAIANIGNAISLIDALRKRGCKFALDDFGSGMSSYSYLKNLNVDFLKIDGAFIKDMANNPVDRAMVESINHIGHVMGIQTIAEFVETEAVLEMLREIGVNYAQGYSVHMPEPLIGSEK